MSFETEWYSMLNVAGVTALVGDRIIPVHEAEGTSAPYVAWQRIATNPANVLEGTTPLSNRVRVQVDCYAEDFDSSIELAAAVRAAVPGYGGTLHGLCINEFDLGFEVQARLFRRVLEFSMFHRSA